MALCAAACCERRLARNLVCLLGCRKLVSAKAPSTCCQSPCALFWVGPEASLTPYISSWHPLQQYRAVPTKQMTGHVQDGSILVDIMVQSICLH